MDEQPIGEFRTFIETADFTRHWNELRLGDVDLAALQSQIVRKPDAAPVVPDGGGFRKMRFRPPSTRSRGKSGGVRV